MDEVTVGSHETRLVLSCRDHLFDGSPQLLRAAIRAPSLDAELDIYEYSYSSLAEFFGTLAATWRGWDGERCYTSPEGELELDARHSGRRIEMTVGLHSHRAEWTISSTVLIDPGEDLSAVARAVRALLSVDTA